MYRVILIDDEQAATQALKRSLEKLPDIEIIGCYDNAEKGIEAIIQLSPDIVFLDIEMPVTDGFMVAKATDHISYHLVFVTAYADHALTAFETKVVDYLLKPVRPARLTRCIEKIQQLDAKTVANETSNISAYDGQTRHLLAPSDICFIESIGRYQQINLTLSGEKKFHLKTIVTEENMTGFEKQLDSKQFMRVHRSYIINLNLIFQLQREARNTLIKLLDVDQVIPVSRSKVSALNEYLRLKHNDCYLC